MNDKARLFELNNQAPFVQLFVSVIIIITTGLLFSFLLILAGAFIFRTGIPEMLTIPGLNAGLKEIAILKYIQVSQEVGLFLLPALVTARLLRNSNEPYLRIDKIPASFSVLMVIILAFSLIPVNNITGMLNSKMNLPGWLSGVEEWMKKMENSASGVTGLLLTTSDFGGLVVNIFILALIPAIAEELIFRGVLQQLLSRVFNSDHLGIWITAIFFSAIHLQFFGFLPRLILGLCFGYLFLWSGNLWISILAHFINNLVAIVMSNSMDMATGSKASGLTDNNIFLPLSGLLVSIGILIYFRAEYKRKGLKVS